MSEGAYPKMDRQQAQKWAETEPAPAHLCIVGKTPI